MIPDTEFALFTVPPGALAPPPLTFAREGEALVVTLPGSLCYYESRAAAWTNALGRVAEDLHRQAPQTKGVLLLQPGPADDRSPAWLAELADSCLFGDLVQRVDTWRWLLSLIRNSPVPWVYAAAGDCQGSSWELALSCQRRYWYRAAARLGFPEIAVGAFPPGGVLESMSKRAGRTRERWQGRPVAAASDALDDGLVNFCSDATEWTDQAKAMFHEVLKVSPKSGVRDLRRRRTLGEVASVDQASRKTAFEQLGNVWRHEHMGTHKDPSAWDYCWQLVKERAKLKEPGDLGRLVCLIASRHLLSPAYQAWLRAHLITIHGSVALTAAPPCLPPVVIDLNYVAPPTETLVRLLRASLRLVFVAAEAKELATALNLLYSRLERAVGAGLAVGLWDRGVTWYQGVCDETRSLVLRWAIDDRFGVAWEGHDLVFLRLEGNASNARSGLMEWAGDGALPPVAQAVAQLVADGLVRAPTAGALPLSVQVRSHFLDEMLSVSRHAEGDLGVVTEGLRASGWRFAGDDEAWDRFLRTRHDAYAASALPGSVAEAGEAPLAWPMDWTTWELGSWKHAKTLAKRLGGKGAAAATDGGGRRWNATALSQHLALFLGLVVHRVVATAVPDEVSVDHLCGAALGLPAVYGTPLTFLAGRGRRRVARYAMTHWPTLHITGSADEPCTDRPV